MVSIWYTRRSDTQGYVPHVKLILKSSVFQPRSSTPLHPRPVFSATYKMRLCTTIRKSAQLARVSEHRGCGVLEDGFATIDLGYGDLIGGDGGRSEILWAVLLSGEVTAKPWEAGVRL
jgi:hypothetical protein